MSETVLAAVEKVLAELGNFPKSGSPQVGRDSEKRVLEARSRLFPAIRGQDPVLG